METYQNRSTLAHAGMRTAGRGHLADHVRKMQALYRGELNGILIHFCGLPVNRSTRAVPPPPSFKRPLPLPDYKQSLVNKQAGLRAVAGFEDDFPSTHGVRPGSIYGGYFGASVMQTEASVWSEPLPDLYDRLDSIRWDPSNPWVKYELEALSWLRDHAPAEIAISNCDSYGPMDIAEALRGPDLYLDFYERPNDLQRLLQRCGEFKVEHFSRKRTLNTHIDNGFICWQGFWTPLDCCSITDDAATNYSREFFDEFSRPVIQSVVERLGGKFEMHLEGSAAHILDSVATMPGLVLLQYTNNPKWPRGIDMIDTLKSKLGKIPSKVLLTPQEFRDCLCQKLLPLNWIYDVGIDAEHMDACVQSPEEAEELRRLAAEYGGSGSRG